MSDEPKFRLIPFYFESITYDRGGLLPDHKGAHAAWYYCRCAIESMEHFDQQIVYVGELDRQQSLANVARAVAKLYNLDSPADFTKYLFMCKSEAARRNIKWDDRIMNPMKHQD